jgi:hypothetical protein
MSHELDAWLDEATPEEATVRLVLNRRLHSEFAAAVEAYERAKPRRVEDGRTLMDDAPDEDADEAALRLVEVEQRITDAERPFTFVKLATQKWNELIEAHPPSAPQLEENPRLDFNVETLYVEAAHLCCTSPGMTREQASTIKDLLPAAKWDEVCAALHRIHVGGSSIPKSVSESVAALRQRLNSTTQPGEASPSQSSAAGSSAKATRNGSKATTKRRSPGNTKKT